MEYAPEDLRVVQRIELSILEEIDRLCTAYDIPYFLESGTALGAMRHGGFIPWDDDIDIGMLRTDYERFLQLASEHLGNDFDLIIPGKTPRYAAMFAKVTRKGTKFLTEETLEAGLDLGIFVDIFPYDNLSDDEKIAAWQIRQGGLWQRISYLYHAPSVNVPHKGLIGLLEKYACRCAHAAFRMLLSEAFIAKRFNKAASAAASENSQRCITFPWPDTGGFWKDRLFPTKRATFEGREFPLPGDAEYFLETMYGSDWTELPPPEKRRNHAPVVLEYEEEHL